MIEPFITCLSAFLGGGLSSLINWIKDNNRIKHQQQYQAELAAIDLEGYVLQCSYLIADHKEHDNDRNIGSFIGKVPQLNESLRYEKYGSLKNSDLSELLKLQQKTLMAQRDADFWWDTVGDHESYHNTVKINTQSMAKEAWLLAKQIRINHKLQDRKLRYGNFDPISLLE